MLASMPLRAIVDDESVISSLCEDTAWQELRALAKRRPSALILPGCQQECYPRVSSKGMRHFVHRPGADCAQHAGESAVHLAAKAAIVQAATAAGWHAQTEVPGDGWIADTLLTRGAAKLAFEVQWSPQTLERYEERQSAYAASGVRALWFAKTLPNVPDKSKGWTARKDLPVFVMDPEQQVDDGGEGVPLKVAVQELLAGRVQFRTQVASPGSMAREHVKVWQIQCWKCRKPTAVWTSDALPVTGACGYTVEQYRFGVLWSASDRPEAHPAIAALAHELAEAAGTRASSLRFRKTRPVPEGYLAFTCGHCPAVQGDWHVRQHLLEAAYEPPLAEGTANLNTIAIASDQPHWCWDRGHGNCPPGESQP